MSETMEAGRELDARVAVEVLGLNLTPPRGYALAKIGASLTSVTGLNWKLTNGVELDMPNGSLLDQPEGTTDWNDRYFAFAAEHSGEKNLEERIAAVRYPTEPYSMAIECAWTVVENLRERGLIVVISTAGTRNRMWDVRGWNDSTNDNRFIAHAATTPLAICFAALKAVGAVDA